MRIRQVQRAEAELRAIRGVQLRSKVHPRRPGRPPRPPLTWTAAFDAPIVGAHVRGGDNRIHPSDGRSEKSAENNAGSGTDTKAEGPRSHRCDLRSVA